MLRMWEMTVTVVTGRETSSSVIIVIRDNKVGPVTDQEVVGVRKGTTIISHMSLPATDLAHCSMFRETCNWSGHLL